jgi:hypothetical protein
MQAGTRRPHLGAPSPHMPPRGWSPARDEPCSHSHEAVNTQTGASCINCDGSPADTVLSAGALADEVANTDADHRQHPGERG